MLITEHLLVSSTCRYLISTTMYDDNKIEFNTEGERINVAYDVTNFVHGKMKVVGHMVRGFPSKMLHVSMPTQLVIMPVDCAGKFSKSSVVCYVYGMLLCDSIYKKNE